MEDKLSQLTEKIYREGVEKAEKKGEEIISLAERKAQDIVSEAIAASEKLLTDSRKDMESERKRFEADIRTSGLHAISTFKQEIASQITADIVEPALSSTLSDPDKITELLKCMIQNWDSSQNGRVDLEAILPEEKRLDIEKAFASETHSKLAAGLKLNFSKKLKAGFLIGPEGGRYKISLTDEDFYSLFKSYLKPKTRSLLFGE